MLVEITTYCSRDKISGTKIFFKAFRNTYTYLPVYSYNIVYM